jgi:hypothetical protein
MEKPEKPTEENIEIVADEDPPQEDKTQTAIDALKQEFSALTKALNPLVEALKPKPAEVHADSKEVTSQKKLEAMYDEVLSKTIPKEKLDSMSIEAKEGAYNYAKTQSQPKADATPLGATYIPPTPNTTPDAQGQLDVAIKELYGWTDGPPELPFGFRESRGTGEVRTKKGDKK